MCDKKFLFIRKTQEEDHNCYSYRQLSVPCNLYRTFALSDDVNIFSALSDVIAESTGVRFDINKAQKLNQEGRFECSEKMERHKFDI